MLVSVAPRKRHPALGWSLLSLLAAPAAGIDVILRTGDPAPGLGAGVTIQSFLEPPSTNDKGHVLLHVLVTGTGVTTANDEVIYRWHRGEGFVRVAREGDAVDFNDGPFTLVDLETPIADNRGWVAFTSQLSGAPTTRGMVVWEPPSTLHGVAKIGETTSIPCITVTGISCNPATVSGPLLNMATFADRRAAIFRTYEDSGLHFHEILVRSPIDNNTFGDPEALWRWIVNETGGISAAVESVAGELEWADSTEDQNYFVAFTDLAACDERFGLFDIQDNAPLTVYRIDELGIFHLLLDRYYTVDTVQRKDLHCFGPHFSYLGARGTIPSDHTQSKRGVFIDTDQVYEATVTSSELPSHTIGAPLGQALTRDDPPKSVFTANMIGTTYNGKAGVWRRGTSGGPSDLLLYELQPLAQPPADVATIWTVHVGGTGAVAFHALMSNANQALIGKAQGSIFGDVFKILTKGDTVPDGAGGTLTVDSFWTLGGTFGSDPVVTGTGGDGHVSALNARGEFVFVVNFTGGGSGMYKATIDPRIFLDGFESDAYCHWSAWAGAPAC